MGNVVVAIGEAKISATGIDIVSRCGGGTRRRRRQAGDAVEAVRWRQAGDTVEVGDAVGAGDVVEVVW